MSASVPVVLADALRDFAFVVVQAPAGYGKTTSVRAALAGEANVAWYDAQPWEADAYPAALVAGVRASRPDAGRLTLALAAEGAEPGRLAATFADELAHVDAPLRIVVDDAHVLGAGFAAFAAALARRMPSAVRLVVLTRAALDLGLPEAVAAGRGALIDTGALRFDAERARALAATLGVPLDRERAAALLQRTDGWPIALALSLRTGSGALLDELVARRLDALDPVDRALLAGNVVHETLEPALIAPGDRAVAGRLAVLAADASLVAAVQGGFRIHPLVRDALARGIDQERLAAQHAAAALRYAAAQRLRPAVFHLERARDAAADEAFLRGYAVAAIASGLVEGVRAALARVRAAGIGAPQLLAYLEGLLAKARGDDARPAFRAAVREADARDDDALGFDARVQLVEGDLARGESVDPARVEELLARAPAHGAPALVAATIRAGWADVLAGRFDAALARLDALAEVEDAAVRADITPLEAYARIALGDFESAERLAGTLIDAWSGADDVARYAGALGWAARFALLRGETTAAYELAREAERIARPFTLRAHAAALHVTLAEAALHVGELDLAGHEARAAERGAANAWYARDAERTQVLSARILARIEALHGDAERALAAASGQDPLTLADAAAFAALAHARDANPRRERARAALTAARPYDGADAVALWAAAEMLDLLDALAGRDVRTPLALAPFEALVARRAEAPRLATLGEALRARAGERFEAGFRLSLAAGPRFETALLARLAAPLREGPARAAAPEPLLETLTAREHEILALLAGGLTNREIGQRLVLSPRTVETHVARITGKLGVASRARAVARAVTLGIVTHPPADLRLLGDGTRNVER